MKELFIRFTARAFRKLLSIYVFSSFRKLLSINVFSYFAFGFEGRIWDLIISVPGHCLSFYLVYKFKKIVSRNDFSDQFRKIIIRYKRIGYNMNVMRETACLVVNVMRETVCLVVNPIAVNNFADLFNCTPVGRASDLMMAPA